MVIEIINSNRGPLIMPFFNNTNPLVSYATTSTGRPVMISSPLNSPRVRVLSSGVSPYVNVVSTNTPVVPSFVRNINGQNTVMVSPRNNTAVLSPYRNLNNTVVLSPYRNVNTVVLQQPRQIVNAGVYAVPRLATGFSNGYVFNGYPSYGPVISASPLNGPVFWRFGGN
jgi:hypothetical protein